MAFFYKKIFYRVFVCELDITLMPEFVFIMGEVRK